MVDWAKVIRKVAPSATPSIAAMVVDHADEVFRKYKFDTLKKQAALIAHLAVESTWFTRLDENLNYSAQRLMQVWPRRFPNYSVAQEYANNPRKLAMKVYSGRMGNRPGTDDAWIFRGQGLLQCTGRDNVTRLAKKLGISPETCAKWLVDPNHAFECAAALFVMLGVMPFAATGDIVGQTKRINGGLHGLDERKRSYERALRELTLQVTPKRIALLDETQQEVTAADLRKAGSRTVIGTDQAKKGLGIAGTALAGVTEGASKVIEVRGQIATIREAGDTAAEFWDYWPYALLALSIVALLVSVWYIWRGLSTAQQARVDDANQGFNIAHIPEMLGSD